MSAQPPESAPSPPATARTAVVPPAGAAAPGPIPCPRCSASVGPEQDWCLECGAPARTRLAPTPNWRMPTLALAVVVALAGAALAVAFVALTDDEGPTPSGGTAPVAAESTPAPTPVAPPITSTLATPTATSTAPATRTAPTTAVPPTTAPVPLPTPTVPSTGGAAPRTTTVQPPPPARTPAKTTPGVSGGQ